MSLYLSGGWLDVKQICDMKYPFVFCYGGRGIGKTFGEADAIANEYSGHVLFLRRTKTEFDIVTSPEMNTFAGYNVERGRQLTFEKQRGFSRIIENGEFMGIAAALSTFSNLRGGGFDDHDITLMLYDEFIPERHKSKIRDESEVLLNVYETVNRNRELHNREPLKLRCFANSNDIKNPIFIGLNLVSMAEKMIRKNREIMIDNERGIALIDCRKSPISQRKSETALYRMSAGSEFFNMAIKNEFNSGLLESRPRPLIEYRPLVTVGEICIYQHKSNMRMYISNTLSHHCETFTANDTQLEMFRIKYNYLFDRYYENRIDFENQITQLLFLTYLKIL